MLSFTAYGIYVLALAAAGMSDLVRYQIPNSLSAALVAGFALVALLLPGAVIVNHVLAGVAVFGVTTVLFAIGVCGGGDVKLLGATALWMGWSNLSDFLLLMALIGAALALSLLLARRLVRSTVLVTTGVRARRLFSKDAGVPYGIAIAVAGLVMVPRLGLLSVFGTN
ncbi:MAG TPA: prepilin peptidase [Methylomirabilota bacterium]|nr:prepilin peptidase [Methylomirabilota bacterium]